jgi:hypothetical protein
MKPKTSTAGPSSNLDKFVDDLDDLSNHASAAKTKVESASGTTSSSAATTFLGLDSFQSRDSRNRSRLGQRNLATDLQEANSSESLSILEEDLDFLLQKPEATARRGDSGCFGANSLMVTSTPEGCFAHWKGMSLSDLLEAEDRLVAHLEPLPFQEGRPLATMVEESTELVDASSDELISRQVLMAEEGEDDGDFPIIEFDVVSEDEVTANVGDETDADHEARRARNRSRTIRRRRVNERRQSMHHELDPEFSAVREWGFRTSVANIARVTAILEHSNDSNVRQALLYVQRDWIQLDQQNPASTVREERVGESRSQAHSRTADGRPRPQPSHNNDNARGSQAPGGRQQPPLGDNPRQANHRPPPEDLRLHINEGRDARSVIDSTAAIASQLSPHGSAATSILGASSRSASPSTMVSKLLSNGYVATPRPLKSQGAPTLPRLSTSRWLWTLYRSHG